MVYAVCAAGAGTRTNTRTNTRTGSGTCANSCRTTGNTANTGVHATAISGYKLGVPGLRNQKSVFLLQKLRKGKTGEQYEEDKGCCSCLPELR